MEMVLDQVSSLVMTNPFTEKELEGNPAKTREFVMGKLGRIPDNVRAVFENTQLDAFSPSPIRYRQPWELIWKNISKGNVCVAGDALHPTTPDLGQGGCAALEDGVLLARCLGEALLRNSSKKTKTEQSDGKVISFSRDKFLAPIIAGLLLKFFMSTGISSLS
ncbi:FAD/NAD(P)-binding domain containing protein [Parasponia andersonii]|uniref:FAD/NAD(P)-binding domain containing protein n=1 Tax=Parasponia andersonii TaxID=3476 RepID=A0A2P5B8E2_PARAD|nr:FAD/NAD(P)-binding domain containing protein [Parasponia andersonii]